MTGKELELWEKWKEELKDLTAFVYPRCLKIYTAKQVTSIQLHMFADASESGFAAVGYIRFIYTLQAKSHVLSSLPNLALPPSRPLTMHIPRLELQAPVLATRLSLSLLKELDTSVHEVEWFVDHFTLHRQRKSTISHVYC